MTLSFTKQGFTLVELMVVLGIIIVLAALIIPMVNVGGRERDRTVNVGILNTVDNALKIFQSRNGFGIKPAWLETDDPEAFGNHLYFRLANPMSIEQKTKFKDHLKDLVDNIRTRHPITIVDPYRGAISLGGWSNSHDEKIDVKSWNQSPRWRYYNNALKELKLRDKYLLQGEYFTSDIIGMNDIGKEFIGEWENSSGDKRKSILDAHGNPIIYAYKFDPGIKEKNYSGNSKARNFKGIADTTTLNADDLIDEDTVFIDVVRSGRLTITDTDFDGSIEEEWQLSDIRTHAIESFELKHELWSAGPDGLFHAIRGESVNYDNVTIDPDKYK